MKFLKISNGKFVGHETPITKSEAECFVDELKDECRVIDRNVVTVDIYGNLQKFHCVRFFPTYVPYTPNFPFAHYCVVRDSSYELVEIEYCDPNSKNRTVWYNLTDKNLLFFPPASYHIIYFD